MFKYKHFLAIQTYGWIHQGEDLTKNGSALRVNHAVNLIYSGVIPKKDLVAIFPQGYSKGSPTMPTQHGDKSLGQNVAEYFSSRPEMEDIKVITSPVSWGTQDDVISAYNIASSNSDLSTLSTIHFVSDPDHLQRVTIASQLVFYKVRYTVFHPAFMHRMSRFERWLREPVGRMLYRFMTNRMIPNTDI